MHHENLHEVLLSLTLHGEHESVYLPLHKSLHVKCKMNRESHGEYV